MFFSDPSSPLHSVGRLCSQGLTMLRLRPPPHIGQTCAARPLSASGRSRSGGRADDASRLRTPAKTAAVNAAAKVRRRDGYALMARKISSDRRDAGMPEVEG